MSFAELEHTDQLAITNEVFDFYFTIADSLPQRFIKPGERYLKFFKCGDADVVASSVELLVAPPHENRRVENLSGGLFDTEITFYMRYI